MLIRERYDAALRRIVSNFSNCTASSALPRRLVESGSMFSPPPWREVCEKNSLHRTSKNVSQKFGRSVYLQCKINLDPALTADFDPLISDREEKKKKERRNTSNTLISESISLKFFIEDLSRVFYPPYALQIVLRTFKHGGSQNTAILTVSRIFGGIQCKFAKYETRTMTRGEKKRSGI